MIICKRDKSKSEIKIQIKQNMNVIISIGKFGALVLTLGEDNFISCVAYFDPGKLQLLMNLCNPRLFPEQDEQTKH